MDISKLVFEEEIISDKMIPSVNIEKITSVPDEISDDTLFVLLKSTRFNEEEILSKALNKNPAVIICGKETLIPKKIPVIRTENTRKLLPFIYARFYGIDFSKTRFVAITGTNGKTSTATMISHILSYSGQKVGFIGTGKISIDGKNIAHSNYSMTTPDPHLLYYVIKEMQNEKCDTIIMEVSSHALYFDKVLPIPFTVSVFTNLSPEHLDFHKDMQNYYETKIKLFEKTKIGIFNMDDAYSKKASQETSCQKYGIGIIQKADAVARDVLLNGIFGSEYIYRELNRNFKVKLKLGGAYNIYNSMLAIAAAIKLGVKPCIAKTAVSNIESIEGRLDIIRSDITVIIDYAHTEEAFKNVLKSIKSSKTFGQKLITIFGCGGNRDKTKRPKIAEISELYSDFVIVTSDNSREESEQDIINDIIKGFKNSEKYTVIPSRENAIKDTVLNAKAGDIIAIIGKGHEKYNIDKYGYHEFNERKIIEDTLNERKRRKGIPYENST